MTYQYSNRVQCLSCLWKNHAADVVQERTHLCGIKHRVGLKPRALAWFAGVCLVMVLVGCNNSTIIRVINQGTDGNSEVWVCEGGAAQRCRGEQQADIDPQGFQKRQQVIAPPTQCTHGRTAIMDVVIKSGKISRVRYECGLPDTPTGLPPSTAPSNTETETPRTN